jgi:hypothetical protein
MRSLKHRFVQYLPETLEPGILYISLEYVTASHLCCCGCGEEVVTPLSPVGWRMTFDGETVSLRPSIGNWNLRCRSHYIIERGRIVVAAPWSNEQVAAERKRDSKAKAEFFGGPKETPSVAEPANTGPEKSEKERWWRQMWRRWCGI